ncbi:MAG: hypothetical protein AB1Z98_34390 [Nannocystaceae bacterium]
MREHEAMGLRALAGVEQRLELVELPGRGSQPHLPRPRRFASAPSW